jgi:hypothetical protein
MIGASITGYMAAGGGSTRRAGTLIGVGVEEGGSARMIAALVEGGGKSIIYLSFLISWLDLIRGKTKKGKEKRKGHGW